MKKLLKVLLIEDSEADAELLKHQLTRDGIIASYHRVHTGEDLSIALDGQPWDIALCDYVMPGFSGLEALKLLREKSPEMPCIIVSGQIGEEIAVSAMKAGATDYIMKDRLKRLAPAIKREIEEAQVRLEKQEALNALNAKEAELRITRELERAKDEFIGFVSHELRTPLAVVIGALHTFLTSRELISKEDQMVLISDAISEAENLSRIVDNLLYLARAQADKMQANLKTVDPADIISEVLQKMRARAAGCQLTADCPQPGKVIADPVKMELILNNLLSNAVKYCPEGEVRVLLRWKDDMALIGVSDRGAGISEEDQKKLFQPFERLRASTSGIKGIGLGLLVSQRLAEVQGGQMWVESKLGEGSTFYFTLRAAK